MRLLQPLAVVVTAAFAANCANVGNFGNLGAFCEERPFLCVLAGAAVIGGIVWIATDDDDDENDPINESGTPSQSTSEFTSDARLKRDIREVGTLPNGLKTYAFRYWNDDRYFVSVLAQEVLADPRHADAVVLDDSGYYKVDLAKIGVRFEGDIEAFEEASRNAIEGL